jgi:hypothetical protein
VQFVRVAFFGMKHNGGSNAAALAVVGAALLGEFFIS